MKTEGKVKAALYARVSTEEQLLGTSLHTQIEDLKRKAEYEQWEVYHLYVDEGKSGTTDKREGLERLLDDAKARRFDIVAVTKLDRFMRKLKLLLDYIDQLNQLGIKFLSVGEGFDTSTSMGIFTLQIMGVIAEWERERIIERTRSGRLARYKEGKWASGHPLYGYQYNPDTKKLEIKEDEARVVRCIFHLYVHNRLGFEQTARTLNKDGIKPSRHGTHWYTSSVADLIKHPGYKGQHPLGISMPPIIEPAIWELAQTRRKSNKHLHRRNRSEWLLQGMVRCGLCGHTLSCNMSHGKRRTYACSGRLQGAKARRELCSLPILDAEWLEDQIWQKVADALSDPNSLLKALDDYILNLANRKQELEAEIQPVMTKRAEIDSKLERLAESYVRGNIRPERWEEMRRELEDERQRLLAIEEQIDPKQLEELESTRTWLGLWQSWKKEFEHNLQFTLEDDTQMEKQCADEFVKVILGIADIDDSEFRSITGSPSTKRQLLDYLHTELWAFHDRVEINALIPVDSINLGTVEQGYNSGCLSLQVLYLPHLQGPNLTYPR